MRCKIDINNSYELKCGLTRNCFIEPPSIYGQKLKGYLTTLSLQNFKGLVS